MKAGFKKNESGHRVYRRATSFSESYTSFRITASLQKREQRSRQQRIY